MSSRQFGLSEMGFALLLAGCAAATAPSPAAEPASEPAADAPDPANPSPTPAVTEPAANASDAASAPEAAPAAKPEHSIAELCGTLCDRVEGKCSKKRAATCRANCPDYVERATRCDAAVRAALECLGEPNNVVCAPFAPEQCKDAVTAANNCDSAAAPGTDAAAATSAAVPAGWERVQAADAGFSALFPKGVVRAQENAADVWKSSEAGVAYQVHISSAPERKDERHLLKSAWAFVGPECTPQLKLHGRIEKQGRVSVRFDSTCKDGASWHGIFHIASNKLYRVAFKAPPGSSGKLDLFVYGFELSAR